MKCRWNPYCPQDGHRRIITFEGQVSVVYICNRHLLAARRMNPIYWDEFDELIAKRANKRISSYQQDDAGYWNPVEGYNSYNYLERKDR